MKINNLVLLTQIPSLVAGVIVEQLFKVNDAVKTGEAFVIIEVAP
jgi:multidrug efflux pump subunit AcrA (membrane-fusion protein)